MITLINQHTYSIDQYKVFCLWTKTASIIGKKYYANRISKSLKSNQYLLYSSRINKTFIIQRYDCNLSI